MIEEELQKELREKYNPTGSELRTFQLNLLEGLRHFDTICKANDINYWLSSGTCLGAIRHGGFIPWDDDIDVEMLREDYLKFVKVFTEDERYVLQTYKNDLYYTQPFPKFRSKDIIVDEGSGIADRSYKFKGLFIDVFVMEPSPRFAATFCHLLVGSMRHFGYRIKKRNWAIDTLYRCIKNCVYGLIAISRLSCFFCNGNTLRHTLGTGLERNIRKKGEIFPLGAAVFEGMNAPIPGNYDQYLRRMFGNYMEIPKDIHTHNLHSKADE